MTVLSSLAVGNGLTIGTEGDAPKAIAIAIQSRQQSTIRFPKLDRLSQLAEAMV
jgi:hypothetical protein